MASSEFVYRTVRDLANKDARGFITPDMFNRFAKVAQLKVYSKIISDLSVAAKAIKTGADPGRNMSLSKGLLQDLAVLSKKSEINVTNGIGAVPDDFYRVIAISTKGQLSLGRRREKQVEIIYDEEKLDRILRSNLSAPSHQFPVALISDTIEVFPENIRKVNLRYYRMPVDPSITAIDRSGDEYISEATDFELSDKYIPDLVVEIAKLVGVNLKEPEVTAFVRVPSTNVVSPK